MLESLFEEESDTKSGAHSGNQQWHSRLSFENGVEQTRLDDEPNDIFFSQQDLGSLSGGSVCEQTQHSTSPLLFLETEPICRRNECTSTEMVQTEALVESPLDTYP